MRIDSLNQEYGLADQVRFRAGRGGLTMIEVANTQARALISLLGAQVLAYRPIHAEADLLFVSERAHFAEGQATKGGIPICWPWFGRDLSDPGRPIHGFVQSSLWTPLACVACADGSTQVRLGLVDDACTRASWAWPFELTAEIRIGQTLEVSLSTRNAGTRRFRITQGLHTYFKIGDIDSVRVDGLAGCTYIDKAADGADALIRQKGRVTFDREVNRIYQGVPAALTIRDPSMARQIRIHARNSHTCVIWNPWSATARQMDDLDDEDYRRFICVETVNTADEVIELEPGQSCQIGAWYAIEPLDAGSVSHVACAVLDE